MPTAYRLLGLPEEIRLAIEQASGKDTDQAQVIIDYSIQQAVQQTTEIVNQSLKELQSLLGPHGTISRLQAGGIRISPGSGLSYYTDGVQKTSILPNGDFAVGSDITQPTTSTVVCFVEDEDYNGESMGAGDLLFGDNSTGTSNVKFDASEGQLQFRYGTTVQAYMDTDGTLKAGQGNVILSTDGIVIKNINDTSDAFIIFRDSDGTALGQILTNTAGDLEIDAYGYAVDNAERKLVLRSQLDDGSVNIATIEIIANTGDTGVDWITLNSDRISLNAAVSINANGDDLDFIVESDTNEYAIISDASANTVSFFGLPNSVTTVATIDGGDKRIEVGGDHYIPIRSATNPNVIFNEANQDMDFTIETVASGSAFKVDAGANKVSIEHPTSGAWKDYITGLAMVWVSATALTVEVGAAYIPSLDYILEAPSDIALTGLSLSNSTWYHVYFYSNSGTPAIELSTTAPAAYHGHSYQKTGDTSRRYVGSVKTDASGNLYEFIHQGDLITYSGDCDLDASPFRALSGGQQTTATAVDLSALIPPTSRIGFLRISSNADVNSFYGPTSNVTGLSLNPGDAATQNAIGNYPLTTSQTHYYKFNVAPTGGAYMDVYGYLYKR